jgi:hypothetical protein
MNVLIHISSSQKGFLMTLGNIFTKKKIDTFYLARDLKVKNFIQYKLSKDYQKKTYIEEKVNDKINYNYKYKDKNQIIHEAKLYERKYNFKFNFIIGKDRALGRGYLLNVDKYPNIIRSRWPKEKKYLYFLNIFKNIEKIILKIKPKIIISTSRSYFLSIISKKLNIRYLTLTSSRLGDRFYWSDNDFNTNTKLINEIKRKGKKIQNHEKYAQILESKKLHAKIKYTFLTIIKDVSKEIIKETKQLLKFNRRKNSYYIFGWVPVRIRKYFAYKYVTFYSKKIDFFKKKKFIYVPLHLEPEIALIGLSPEFNNTIEMITWISKNLPADYSIVVKEQPFAYGTRSFWYYNCLREMPNVYFAHPKIHPWEWIKNSFCVSTITGSAAYEAVNFKIPVLSFGKNQIVNFLPTVKYCNNFIDVRKNIEKLLKKYPSKTEFSNAKRSLISAIYKSSFRLPDYIKTYEDTRLENPSAYEAFKYIL